MPDKRPVGRPKKYPSKNARSRAWRARQRELGQLLMIEHPEVGSSAFAFQTSEVERLIKGERPVVATPKIRQQFRKRVEATLGMRLP